MILGFKAQFKPLILNGTKIHTIREDKHGRWKKGNKIHFATGVRTRNYKQFKAGVCAAVQPILLVNHGNHVYCRIQTGENAYIHNDCIEHDNTKWHKGYPTTHLLFELCRNDGLTWGDFKEWFIPNHGDKFTGKIIHWTEFKYSERLIVKGCVQ